jgi:hypothetical protein
MFSNALFIVSLLAIPVTLFLYYRGRIAMPAGFVILSGAFVVGTISGIIATS